MLGALRALGSILLDRRKLAALAGLTFGGKRDLYEAFGYKRELTLDDYRSRFRRGGVAGSVVESPAKATWKGNGEVIEDEDPEILTPFEEAWAALDARLSIWPTFQNADILAGIGHYSVIVLGAPGNVAEPLTECPPDSLVYLHCYAEDDAKIVEWDREPSSARFGQATFYQITRTTPEGRKFEVPRVHWTRVIHIAEGLLEDRVYGTPRLERVWNLCDDLEKMTGGGAEAFYQRAHPGTQFDLDKETKLDPAEETQVKTEIDRFIHGFQRHVRTRGVDMNVLSAETAPFANDVDAILTQIAGTSGIPKRILTGAEQGELASSQDRNNWNDRIKDRRASWAAPYVVRVFVDRLIALKTLPAPAAREGTALAYDVVFAEFGEMTDLEKAELGAAIADMNQKQGENVITSNEIRADVFGKEPLEEDEMSRAGEMEEDPALAETEPEEEPRAAARFVDRSSGKEPWRAVHRAADKHVSAVTKLVSRALAKSRNGLTIEGLSTAVRQEDRFATERLVIDGMESMREALTDELPDALLDVLLEGARAEARSAQRNGGFRAAASSPIPGPLQMVFDRTNPEATAWAREHSSTLIRQITEETRQAVRAVIAQAFDEGLPPREAAKLIRKLVGLTHDQTVAVINARVRLANAAPGSIVKVGKQRIRVPQSGASSDLITRVAREYADRLHKQRALNIARTETMAASNEGQRQLWAQAVTRQNLTGNELREWITTPDDRLCPLCASMSGQLRGLDEPFQAPGGGTVMNPPLHPSCRCAQGISARKRSEVSNVA